MLVSAATIRQPADEVTEIDSAPEQYRRWRGSVDADEALQHPQGDRLKRGCLTGACASATRAEERADEYLGDPELLDERVGRDARCLVFESQDDEAKERHAVAGGALRV